MASSPGKSVGRLLVRVLPDSRQFRQDLLKILKRAEATNAITLKVDLDFREAYARLATFRDFVRTNSGITLRLNIENLDRLREILETRTVTVNVDTDIGAALARLAALTLPRTATINARVTPASIAAAASALAALSGARVVGERLGALGSALGNLDRNLPRIGAVGLAIGSLGSVALSSLSGIAGIATSIASIGGAALALPGIFAGVAIGMGVMTIAMQDATTQLASLEGPLTRLRDSISAEFWQGARGPILEMARTLLPELRSGANGVAESLGTWAGSLTTAMGSILGGGVLETMFASLGESITIAAGGTDSLVGLIGTLGTLGSSLLPRLATGFVQITGELNAFLGAAAADGRLEGWMNAGIAAAGQLMGVLANLGQILGGIGTAAAAAGTGGLASLNQALGGIALVVNGPAFQGALVTFFQGAAVGMAGLATAIGPLGDMLVALAPTLANIMGIAGTAIGGLLSALAGALAQPAFATGLQSFFEGIAAGAAALAPALGPIANALGILGVIAGQLGATIGQTLGAALTLLAPILSDILISIQPLIPILGGALLQIIQTLAPILSGVISAVLPPLVTAIGGIITALSPLLTLLTPLSSVFVFLAEVLGAVVAVVGQALIGALTAILPAVGTIAAAFGDWVLSLIPLVPAFLELALAIVPLAMAFLPVLIAIIPQLVALFREIQDSLIPLIPSIVELVGALVPLAAALLPLITALIPPLIALLRVMMGPIAGVTSALAGGLTSAVRTVSGAIETAIGVITRITENVRGMREGFTTAASSITTALGEIRDKVVGVFSAAGTWLIDAGKSIISGLAAGIRDKISSVTDAVGDVLSAARDLLPFSPAKEGPFSGRGWTLYSGRSIVDALATGMRSRTANLRAATLDVATAAHPGVNVGTIAAGSYTAPANGAASAGAQGPAVATHYHGDFYSYDPTDVARQQRQDAARAATVARLRTIARGS